MERCARRVVALLACLALSALVSAETFAARAGTGDRGYELINNASAGPHLVTAAVISDDGDRVTFLEEAYSPLLVTAVRGSDRWHATNMVPFGESLLDGSYGSGVFGYTRDRSKAVVGVYAGLALNGKARTTVVRVDSAAHQTVFFTKPGFQFVGMLLSDRGDHGFGALRQVFDYAQPDPLLVSILPNGLPPACGVTEWASQGNTIDGSEARHWISADGARVFFGAQADDSCTGPHELYVRDLADATTTLISGPALSGPETGATFVEGSRDGTSVIFVTTTRLDPSDENSGMDVYRWRVGGGSECLTCLVGDAGVSDHPGSVLASEDLSHVYFVSTHQLAPGAREASENLYVWHGADGDERIDYVSPFEFGDNEALVNSVTGALTPDGTTLVFASRSPEFDSVTGRSNGGHLQYYRYDDKKRTLECLSCPVAGTATMDVTTSWGGISLFGGMPALIHVRLLSNDGSRFAFMTRDALVDSDVNKDNDIYEWHSGHVVLITDGVSRRGVDTALYGMSASGRDIIFSTLAALTPDAVDDSLHLYDARVGGGYTFSTKRGCEGQACRLASSQALGPLGGTIDFDALPDGSPRLILLGKRVSGFGVMLRIRVAAAGSVTVKGERVQPLRRRLTHASLIVLRLRLTPAAVRLARRMHRLRVSVLLRYTPMRGTASRRRVSALVRD